MFVCCGCERARVHAHIHVHRHAQAHPYTHSEANLFLILMEFNNSGLILTQDWWRAPGPKASLIARSKASQSLVDTKCVTQPKRTAPNAAAQHGKQQHNHTVDPPACWPIGIGGGRRATDQLVTGSHIQFKTIQHDINTTQHNTMQHITSQHN